jgi:nucleoside-diphosphate-sugar epimerase
MAQPVAMHAILGANGVIGRELAQSLARFNEPVRQVSRSPQKVNASDEVVAADLLDAAATARAVAGSDVAYLVAGLPYRTNVWREQWPRVMRNVIDACKRHRVKLVFFDNVYAYGRVAGVMTEDTPFHPVSGKGEARAAIANMLLDEMRGGALQAMIVRSADFYGPGAVQSLTDAVVIKRIKAGKTPQWVGNRKATHTFTFTPDAGHALAMLARTPDAYGQTWHAPTSKEPMSGETFARLACELAGRPYKLQVAPRWMLRLLGLFHSDLRESAEMMYQFEHDYRFDSSKIEAAFGLTATPYREGIHRTMTLLDTEL